MSDLKESKDELFERGDEGAVQWREMNEAKSLSKREEQEKMWDRVAFMRSGIL